MPRSSLKKKFWRCKSVALINIKRRNEGEEEETVENEEQSGGMLGDAYKGLNNISKFTGWGKKDEPDVEILDISEIPDNFDITQEVLADDECYRITLEIIKASDLAAMDNNGLSDPFVEIVMHKDLVLKSKVINKSINPVWNEKFTLHIDDRSALANIHVLDHDIFGANDRIGYIDLDLASIPPFHRYTTTINLASSVDGQDFVGTLTFSYLVEIVNNSVANDIKSIGTKGQERLLGIIQITVIEGMDLPPMNSDGTCDPFIRLQLSDQQFETKVIPSTLNPKWRESFEFRYLSTSGDMLQASLWDSEVGISDNIIGDTEIDLSKIAPNKPFKYIFGLDHTNTKISLLIKILKFAELGAAELQLQKEINDAETRILKDQYALVNTGKDFSNVGYLIVKLIRATNLPSKKIGSMDPYVVMEIENCRSISPVREDCLEPEWKLTYRFPINDYHSVLHLSLCDEEDLVNDVLVGRIAIPLFNCRGLKKYILKDAKLTGVGKGELIIETAVFYNPIRAAVRTFSPKEEKIMKDPTKFDISLLQRDVKRITAQLEMVQDMGEGLDQIIRWRNKPLSFVSMIIFVLVTYYIELWMVPLAIGLLLLYSHVAQRCGVKKKETWVRNNVNRAYYEVTRETEGESTGFSAKLDKMKTVFTTAEGIQKGLDFAASIGEKFGHIGQWKNQFVSAMCCVILISAGCLLYYVSPRYMIIVWGLNKFRKFYFQPNLVDNNEMVDLLSRIPSFPEIEQYRQIRSRGSGARPRSAAGSSRELNKAD
ncbi:multiple C2 and transmembrane domain-containing protein 1-like isoform X2 [Bolinopsis microptera]|uniref:multiple C2 and transmembrane domain-containing protein 1-like isoform X2 n=1 Tax=Bolinopsis microptera TaxID=2820187 RepID=UPI003078D970